MQNLNKWTIIMIVAVIGIVGFLFLPLVSVSGFGVSESASFFDALKAGTVDFGLSIILILGGSIATIVTAFQKIKNATMIASGAGVVGCLLEIITSGSQLEELKQMGLNASLGFAMWVILICCAVNVFLAFKAE